MLFYTQAVALFFLRGHPFNFPVLGNSVFDTGESHVFEVYFDGISDLFGVVTFVRIENFDIAGSHLVNQNFAAAGGDEAEDSFVCRPVVSACFFEGHDVAAYKVNTRSFYDTCECVLCVFFLIFHFFGICGIVLVIMLILLKRLKHILQTGSSGK